MTFPMLVLGRILITIASVLHFVLYIYGILVIAAIIISWVRPSPDSPFVYNLIRLIRNLTEPLFYQVRKRLPASWFQTGIDFSPLLVGLVIFLADSLVVGTLMDLGYRLRLGAL